MNPDRLVVVALGSNLGDSAANLDAAANQLRTLAADFFAISSPLRTQPVDCPPGSPDFLNAVAAFTAHPDLQPLELLRQLQTWEKESGRRPKQVLNEARPLDLDLISFGRQTMRTPELVLPHPRAHQREFVLAPLVELLPDLRLPGWTGSARQLLEALRR